MCTRNGSELLLYIVPFGALDLKAAETALVDADVSFREFADYLDDFIEDTGMNFLELDICALVYEFILQQVRSEIEELTGHDISETEIYTYGNYYCSCYDRFEAVSEIVQEIPEEERSRLLHWFVEQIGWWQLMGQVIHKTGLPVLFLFFDS